MKDKNTKPFDISRLIVAHLYGELNECDENRLEQWLDAAPGRREMLAEMEREDMCFDEVSKLLARETDKGRAWAQITRSHHRRAVRRRVVVVCAVAATLFGVFLVWNSSAPDTTQYASLSEPGRNAPRWITSSGEVYMLDTLTRLMLPTMEADNSNGELILTEVGSETIAANEAAPYYTLEIPRSGEYKMTLADGTTVFLNSETTLRFPGNFTTTATREVYLNGEAFFEVAPNADKPFIVHTESLSVKVLGTSFNLSCYAEDDDVRTTLASGLVEVISGSETVLLHPGEQAVLRNEHLDVRKVDIDMFTNWMDDSFRFKNESIDYIMRRLARWYDVTIEYEDPSLRNSHFSGYLPRYTEIGESLELLSLTTKISFNIEGNVVKIKKR